MTVASRDGVAMLLRNTPVGLYDGGLVDFCFPRAICCVRKSSWLLKAVKVVYIVELHDMALKEEWPSYRRSSMKDYDRIYEGLDKTFYSRKWVMDIAERNHKKVLFTSSENSEYWNSRFVYNCFIY